MSNIECAHPRSICVEKGAGRLKRPVYGGGGARRSVTLPATYAHTARTCAPRWATLRSTVAARVARGGTIAVSSGRSAAQSGHIAVNRDRTCGARWHHCGQPCPHVRRELAPLRSIVAARAARAGHIAVNRVRTCGARWHHCGQPWPTCGASWHHCGQPWPQCGARRPHCGNRGRTCGARWQRCGQPWPTCGASWQRCYPSCTQVCTHRGTLLHAGCARAPSSASLSWKGFSPPADRVLRIARCPAIDR